ncbi:uracil-DNA glycosylase [Acidithiobacillus ferrooxidans]|nr:uracil-DNA glycosylase [Acidithiobacillus ferriphilus]MBU2857993.1 uracil-DNA glycosylase [Acidithiobacillus ferrooxidans]
MATHSFVRALAALSFDNCFNPYSDRCEVHDLPDAPQRRAALLSAMLSRAQSQDVDAVWIGRDLGYRGGRRTGLALTDDIHIVRHADRWGISADRPTIGSAVSERTAAVIWSMLERIEAGIFLWNVFPLHPHDMGSPFTNRQHNVRERRAGEEVLGRLIQLLKPRRIVAIGNDAAMAVARLESLVPIVSVRHPSYGGQRQFMDQISEMYSIIPTQQVGLF